MTAEGTSRPDGNGVPPLSDPVEAVVFDWGGTLTPWHSIDLRAQWVTYADGYGLLACPRDDLATRILAAEDAAWARARTEYRSARLVDILAEAGVDPDSAPARAAQAAYEEFWAPHTVTHPDVEPLFRGLHERGIKVGVLSNTIWTRAYHRGVFARDGVLDLIDADVYSSEIAHAKPHPEIFFEAARRLGVQPRRCVYVGDRAYEDVHGGHGAGMRTVLVPHSDIPAAQLVAVDAGTDVPDAVAHDLLDILTILDDWQRS